ncbi:MAG: ASCH domain-containing protein [Chloroflexi bacterium]|nr:ASCH domain-containing protein [Chloroflexota bacterium]
MSHKVLLLSIHPVYVDRIFEGTKKVELRRIRPEVVSGDWVFVYATSPVRALIGAFEVERVVEALPHNLWDKVQNDAGITRKQFDAYYLGASIGFGIFVSRTWSFPEPLELVRLRQLLPNFRPPQAYRYLTDDEAEVFRKLA